MPFGSLPTPHDAKYRMSAKLWECSSASQQGLNINFIKSITIQLGSMIPATSPLASEDSAYSMSTSARLGKLACPEVSAVVK